MTTTGSTFPVFNITHFENVLPTIERRLTERQGPTDPRLAGKRPVVERPLVDIPLRFKKRPKVSGNVLADETEGSARRLSDTTPPSLDIGMPDASTTQTPQTTSLNEKIEKSKVQTAENEAALTPTSTPTPTLTVEASTGRPGSSPLLPMERALKSLDRDLTGKIDTESRRLSRIIENRADGVHRRIDRCISPIRGDLDHLERRVSGLGKDTTYIRNKLSSVPTSEFLHRTVEEASVNVLAQTQQKIAEEVPTCVRHAMTTGNVEITNAITSALRDDMKKFLPDMVETLVRQTVTEVIRREVEVAMASLKAGLRDCLPQMVTDIVSPQIEEILGRAVGQAAEFVVSGNAQVTEKLEGVRVEVDGVGKKVEEIVGRLDEISGKVMKTDGRMADVLHAQLHLSNMMVHRSGTASTSPTHSIREAPPQPSVQRAPDAPPQPPPLGDPLGEPLGARLTSRLTSEVGNAARRTRRYDVTDGQACRSVGVNVSEATPCVDLVREAYGIPKGFHWNGFKVPQPPGSSTSLRTLLSGRAYFVGEGGLIQSKGRIAIERTRVQDFLAAMEKEVPTIVTSSGDSYHYGGDGSSETSTSSNQQFHMESSLMEGHHTSN